MSETLATTGLTTGRLWLRIADSRHAEGLQRYLLDNRAHLSPWEPLRQAAFFELAAIEARLDAMRADSMAGRALHLLVFDRANADPIGECNFTNIVRGPFQACHLGFSIAHSHQGRGLMREALQGAVGYVFDELRLHRIMANYRPENERSARVLHSLGFEKEGYARAYLKINGVWADHVLTSLIRPAGEDA